MLIPVFEHHHKWFFLAGALSDLVGILLQLHLPIVDQLLEVVRRKRGIGDCGSSGVPCGANEASVYPLLVEVFAPAEGMARRGR